MKVYLVMDGIMGMDGIDSATNFKIFLDKKKALEYRNEKLEVSNDYYGRYIGELEVIE